MHAIIYVYNLSPSYESLPVYTSVLISKKKEKHVHDTVYIHTTRRKNVRKEIGTIFPKKKISFSLFFPLTSSPCFNIFLVSIPLHWKTFFLSFLKIYCMHISGLCIIAFALKIFTYIYTGKEERKKNRTATGCPGSRAKINKWKYFVMRKMRHTGEWERERTSKSDTFYCDGNVQVQS